MMPKGCGNCNFQGDSRIGNNGTETYCMVFSKWDLSSSACPHYIGYSRSMGLEQRQKEAEKVLAGIIKGEDINREIKSEKSKVRREWIMVIVNSVISIVVSVIAAYITANYIVSRK